MPATVIAGIVIPSTSPLFLAGVAVHVAAGVTCVVAGAVALLSPKGRGRHSRFGAVYFWSLAVVCGSAGLLAAARWTEDRVLFALAVLSLTAALIGRAAARQPGAKSLRVHMTGMGASYIILLTAFYVDNGRNLPVWRDLPSLAYWLTPSAVGLPLMLRALLRHPLLHRPRRPAT